MAFFSAGWSRLPREQRRVWAAVSGAILLGSVFKVAYFSFSRNLMVADHRRRQEEGTERLREAGEFAEWSRRDRESRLPPLTPQESEQLREYLRLVESHGMHMAAAVHESGGGARSKRRGDAGDCPGCPVLSRAAAESGTATAMVTKTTMEAGTSEATFPSGSA